MKRLLSIVAPYRDRVILSALCSTVVSAANGSLAWLVKPAVDKIFIQGNSGYLVLIGLGVAAVFLLRGVFSFAQNYLMHSVGAKIVRDIRNDLFSHMAYLPLSDFGAESTGAMMSRVISDAATLQELLALRVKDLFVRTGTILVLVGVAFYRRWDLTLIALTVLPFAFYAVGRLGKRLKRVSVKAQMKLANISESLAEGIRGIKIVKSFNMQDRETARFREMTQSYYREYMRSIRIRETAGLIMEVVAGAGIAVIIYYGGTLVAGGAMSSGDFFSFLAAIFMVYTPAKKLAQIGNSLQQARAYVTRIDEVLSKSPEPEGAHDLQPFEKAIAYESVSFRYPGRESDAVRGVDLAARKGELVALVGRSGSGKTTLLDLLSRFYLPQEGRILIDGMDISQASLRSLRGQIGVVSQDVLLFNGTVGANIAYGKEDAGPEEVERAARAAFAHDFIMELPQGYETVIGEGGARLSGGQRQRISIARAILKDPPILILDEATSSLDTQSELMVQRALDTLMEKREAAPEGLTGSASSGSYGGPSSGKTVFVIAHRLSTIRKADRIVVLEDGRVKEEGSHKELLARGGIYRELYALQGSPDARPL
jgi:subfamily B ATP-binding cassette protein MsbA